MPADAWVAATLTARLVQACLYGLGCRVLRLYYLAKTNVDVVYDELTTRLQDAANLSQGSLGSRRC